MNLQELAQSCADEINLQTDHGIENAKPHIVLKMRCSKREPKTRRLVPGGHCPIGNVIARHNDGDIVAFDATDVLAWCVANGANVHLLVKQEVLEGGEK